MLGKLAWCNMKRSARDYLVYVLTMTIIAALMYAFNSLIFQNEIARHFDELEDLMTVMLILATVFIVFIVAWLINYMVRFMLEKRSSEFGIYMLLGMKKKMISRLYMRENALLGGASFLMGLCVGIFLREVLLAVMFSVIQMEYHMKIEWNPWTILMTVLCYAGCYILALFRCKRKFRKMNIHDLMNADRRNEEIREKHERGKRVLFPLSILFILVFWTIFKSLSNTGEILLFLLGLVITIYLFYVGLSAWIICYVRDRGTGIYRGQNLFLLRQFAAKVRTMQFTMGTLTALFTLALLGASIALLFSEYENTVLKEKFPFDIQIYSSDAQDDFADDIEVIKNRTKPVDIYPYHIYTDSDNQVNAWMLSNLRTFGTMYRRADGSADMKKIEKFLSSEDRWAYCTYDTYMGISDYNHLRSMLGYKEVTLGQGEYLVHIKKRLSKEIAGIEKGITIADESGKETLCFAGIYQEAFSQDGHNGGDYIVVVPDGVLRRMKPYYSELAVNLKGAAPDGLNNELDDLSVDQEKVFGGHVSAMENTTEGNSCSGSDNIISVAVDNLVRDNLIPEVKYMLATIMVPLFYIGLVFVCVAVTVLSVQQLSDSAKYKFRYDVLAKMGLRASEVCGLVQKQLVAYYLCPALLAMVISGRMILFISTVFVRETGVPVLPWIFFWRSAGLFFGIYLVYFVVTYIGFKRNILY